MSRPVPERPERKHTRLPPRKDGPPKYHGAKIRVLDPRYARARIDGWRIENRPVLAGIARIVGIVPIG